MRIVTSLSCSRATPKTTIAPCTRQLRGSVLNPRGDAVVSSQMSDKLTEPAARRGRSRTTSRSHSSMSGIVALSEKAPVESLYPRLIRASSAPQRWHG
jgi:hypothetical protein